MFIFSDLVKFFIQLHLGKKLLFLWDYACFVPNQHVQLDSYRFSSLSQIKTIHRKPYPRNVAHHPTSESNSLLLSLYSILLSDQLVNIYILRDIDYHSRRTRYPPEDTFIILIYYRTKDQYTKPLLLFSPLCKQ